MPVNLPVQVTTESKEENGHARMLGGGGMFIGTSHSFAPGTPLTVRFRPARHLPVMEVKARVCYLVAEQGIGIEFTGIEPEHRKYILRLIHHRRNEQRRFPRVPLATQVVHDQGSLIGFSRRALAAAGGNRTKAAELLRIHRVKLHEKIKRYGIAGPSGQKM